MFEPTPLEVHRQAASWFWDQKIFDFVAAQLHLMAEHSLRTYRQAHELKQAGLDWRRAVLSRCLSGPALLVARLKADSTFTSEAARVRAFVAAGGGCRATYYLHARKRQPAAPAPKIALSRATPPAESSPDHLDQLRQRFGQLGNG
jgi:hypothetical protein